jgi:cytochrome c biogenesis factor
LRCSVLIWSSSALVSRRIAPICSTKRTSSSHVYAHASTHQLSKGKASNYHRTYRVKSCNILVRLAHVLVLLGVLYPHTHGQSEKKPAMQLESLALH